MSEQVCPAKSAGGILPCEYLRCYGVKGSQDDKGSECPKGTVHCWRCGAKGPDQPEEP